MLYIFDLLQIFLFIVESELFFRIPREEEVFFLFFQMFVILKGFHRFIMLISIHLKHGVLPVKLLVPQDFGPVLLLILLLFLLLYHDFLISPLLLPKLHLLLLHLFHIPLGLILLYFFSNHVSFLDDCAALIGLCVLQRFLSRPIFFKELLFLLFNLLLLLKVILLLNFLLKSNVLSFLLIHLHLLLLYISLNTLLAL